MKIRTRKKINPIHVRARDKVTLLNGGEKVLSSKIGRSMTLDEVGIFDVEEGDFKGAKGGIGGAFLTAE